MKDHPRVLLETCVLARKKNHLAGYGAQQDLRTQSMHNKHTPSLRLCARVCVHVDSNSHRFPRPSDLHLLLVLLETKKKKVKNKKGKYTTQNPIPPRRLKLSYIRLNRLFQLCVASLSVAKYQELLQALDVLNFESSEGYFFCFYISFVM